jgi:hypothetical protein
MYRLTIIPKPAIIHTYPLREYVMKAANFLTKYTGPKGKGFIQPYDKVKATEKWVEYALDIVDMSRIIMTVDFNTKWKLAEALEVAERKKAWMYKHKNFDVNRAAKLFDTVKHLPRTK